MARSSLVCSIWQRYDFIPNIRCYQPEKSADPELKRGSVFNLPLSFNQRMIDEMGMASWADITGTIYYDVPVCKEEDKDIDDIYECESINGIYYGSDQIR